MIFSTGDKAKILSILLINPILVNLAWYYTQDAIISLSVFLLLGLMLLPKLISSILKRDIYELLTYKGISSAF